MGVASSKLEDDKALQLCRERKKFVKQALNGRCALAAAHIAYIHSLKTTGTALRKFMQPDAPVESSLYTSNSATPEPLALTEKSYSRFSFSSPSTSQNVDPDGHLMPSPSPPTSGRFQVHHMKLKGSFTRKVEERSPVVVTGTVTSLTTSQNTTPRFHEQSEPSPSGTPIHPPKAPAHHPESPTHQPETTPWDYFGLFHPIDNHLSSHEQREVDYSFRNDDDLKHTKEDEDVSGLGHEEDKISSPLSQDSESDDEFDDPASETLVRSFKNLNREESHFVTDSSPTARMAASLEHEDKFMNDEKVRSPKLSPLKTKPSEDTVTTDTKSTKAKDDDVEHKIAPKDFFSSVRDVEHLFVKASESGKEVPRMLEANKLHFRPLLPAQESGGSITASLLRACFSCGDDPTQIQEEPAQASVKYLTWHRAASFRSASSRNPLDANSRDDIEDYTNDLFENSYKISGSHASTLDRLFAWEKKLYDEVKASQLVRRDYDGKCKLLREQESRCESQKIDKTRAVVKDLHSRIRIAIHRIDSISRRIEVMRDQELQPQLEELSDGLRRMWEVMYECHKLQVHIISISFDNGNAKLFLQSESRRQITVNLEHELSNLSVSFTKWTTALKTYIKAINDWLHKCVSVPEKSSKKQRWATTPLQLRVRNAGPPIYTTCGVWLDSLLSEKDVSDTIKGLAAEISHFIPRQEKAHGKKTRNETDTELEMLTPHDPSEDRNKGYDRFRTSLLIFLKQLCNFSEHSVKIYVALQNNIQEAKRNYEHKMSQP